MPEGTPTPDQAPAQAPAATPTQTPTAENIGAQAEQFANKVKSTTADARQKLRNSVPFFDKWLRTADTGDAKESSLKMTIPHILNDAIDATALNVGRRTKEVLSATMRPLDATFGVVGIPFSPLQSLKHPIKTGAKIGRTLTASTHFFAESVATPVRLIDDVVNRGVKRILQRLGYKTPLVGGLLSKGGSSIGWLINQPRRLTEWFSEKTKAADNYMESKAA